MKSLFLSLAWLATMIIGFAGSLEASGKKPPEKPKAEQKSTLKDAENSANRALNNLDRGIHQAGGEVKDGANKALQSVDDTIHGRKK